MKKKVTIFLLSFIFLLSNIFIIQEYNTDATPGMLKQKTVRKCKGKYYGKHKNHWHKAKKSKKNKKWYASGASLGKKKPKACR